MVPLIHQQPNQTSAKWPSSYSAASLKMYQNISKVAINIYPEYLYLHLYLYTVYVCAHVIHFKYQGLVSKIDIFSMSWEDRCFDSRRKGPYPIHGNFRSPQQPSLFPRHPTHRSALTFIQDSRLAPPRQGHVIYERPLRRYSLSRYCRLT